MSENRHDNSDDKNRDEGDRRPSSSPRPFNRDGARGGVGGGGVGGGGGGRFGGPGGNSSDGGPGGSFAFRKRRRRRRKVCQFCSDKNLIPDYKSLNIIGRHTSPTGKILGRRNTGTCAWHQRAVKKEIKKARNIALLAYSSI